LIRVNNHPEWLYAAVDPETNKTLYVRLFQAGITERTLLFLRELHQGSQSGAPQFSSIVRTISEGYTIDFDSDFRQFARKSECCRICLNGVKPCISSFANTFHNGQLDTVEARP
jgi:hypothetical protein